MKSFVRICLWVVGVWMGFASTGLCEEGPATASAESSSATVYAPFESCRCAGDGGPIVAHIRSTLSEPLKQAGLDFTEEPLENVVNFLQDEYQIPIQIDERALEDAGLTREEAISINLQKVSLRSALRLLLKTKQLTYLIRDEVLIITTPEEAESELVTCVYDVRDLVETNRVDPPKGASSGADFDPLVDSIVCCVAAETWAENGGGEAEIRTLPAGLLVISQTESVHEDVANLLAALRATLKSRKTVSPAAAMTEPKASADENAAGAEPQPAAAEETPFD